MWPKNWIIKDKSPSRNWNAEAWNGIKNKPATLIEHNAKEHHMLLSNGACLLVEVEGDPQGRQWWMRPDEMIPQ